MNSLDFLDAGCRRYSETGMRHTDFLLQKRIYDVIGTKYWLNIYCYINKESKERFEAEVQFRRKGKPLNAYYWHFQSIEEVESVFEELWNNMCFYYSERNS
jgi:hypothetical protein